MSAILVKLYDPSDREICFWLPLGKNGKKRLRPQPVKLSFIDKLIRRIWDICKR